MILGQQNGDKENDRAAKSPKSPGLGVYRHVDMYRGEGPTFYKAENGGRAGLRRQARFKLRGKLRLRQTSFDPGERAGFAQKLQTLKNRRADRAAAQRDAQRLGDVV